MTSVTYLFADGRDLHKRVILTSFEAVIAAGLCKKTLS